MFLLFGYHCRVFGRVFGRVFNRLFVDVLSGFRSAFQSGFRSAFRIPPVGCSVWLSVGFSVTLSICGLICVLVDVEPNSLFWGAIQCVLLGFLPTQSLIGIIVNEHQVSFVQCLCEFCPWLALFPVSTTRNRFCDPANVEEQ